ncbi:MAG TPA: hypothetical protein PLE19_19925 [Planctomycetota bacterium]|nr:hypothetical protein [Planctomycetota bacterium]HRR81779.1 hypothetical protein [Planctomycetota bacterium]HRT96770.1 hypothetical protein [Planctomycetota bacterium]
MAWQRIGPGIAVSRPLGELRAAFARTDLFALDLDECIFPRISQETLGRRIARRLLRRPARASDRRLFARLLVGGAYRALTKAKRLAGGLTPAARLIAWYEWTMRGVPEHYFVEAAGTLPRQSHALAAECIALMAEHAPTGLATLGLDVVARAYLEQVPGLTFFEANTLVFEPGPRGERVFAGYDPARLLANGAAKRQSIERRLTDTGAGVPTAVGHNEDDVPLARLARERGGLAIGFNPPPRLHDAFDAVVTGPDWEPMYALVAILEGVKNE